MAKINLDSMLKKAKDKGVDSKEASEKNIFDKPWKANSSVYIENTLDSNVTPNVSSNNTVINSASSTSSTETIISIEPSEISRWSLKDRPENELGDISELARTFKEVGQQVPCIIRPAPDKNGYELIVGERRWHAAKEAGVKLKAILKNLSDHEAGLIQAIENEQRHGLSDYAKGMSYYRMIEKGILKQKDLIDKLNMSQQQVSRLLSFSKIPPEITYALEDMTKISSRTSEEIVRL